jgi:putative Holliday junction resolvase
VPRIIALDYGMKRIGIAVTDPLQIIATGLDTVNGNEIIRYLKNYLNKEEVECFVVGEPRQMDATDSEIKKQVNHFINGLRKNFPAIPVERYDERFTSQIATKSLLMSGVKKKDRQNKELVDRTSAVLILQSYLESRKSKER